MNTKVLFSEVVGTNTLTVRNPIEYKQLLKKMEELFEDYKSLTIKKNYSNNPEIFYIRYCAHILEHPRGCVVWRCYAKHPLEPINHKFIYLEDLLNKHNGINYTQTSFDKGGYCVCVVGRDVPRYVHSTKESAMKEALRLRKEENVCKETIVVFKVVDVNSPVYTLKHVTTYKE